MIKIITHPKDTNFKLLKVAGTLLIAVGLIFLAFALYTVIASFFLVGGMNVGPVWSLLSLLYALVVLVSGHLLHWLVAMWEARQESTEVLKELRRDLQHNNTMQSDPASQGR